MELIPEILVDKIYDFFLDLCFLEHRKNFVNILKELVCKTKFVNVGFNVQRQEFDNSFVIFGYDDEIINCMIRIDMKYWKLRHSWLYMRNEWHYSTTEYLKF